MTSDPEQGQKTSSQKAKEALTGFAANAKAAAQLTAKQAERTKLTNMTLPHAYRELGKDIHATGRYRDQFPEEFAKADELKDKIAGLRQAAPDNEGEAKSFTDRAKETAGKTRDAAHAKKLEVELNSALRKLGRAAFEKLGANSGSPKVVGPIEECQQRLATLDGEIQAIDSKTANGVLTPRRLLVGAGVVAVLALVLGAWAMLAGTSKRITRPPIEAAEPTDASVKIDLPMDEREPQAGDAAEELREEVSADTMTEDVAATAGGFMVNGVGFNDTPKHRLFRTRTDVSELEDWSIYVINRDEGANLEDAVYFFFNGELARIHVHYSGEQLADMGGYAAFVRQTTEKYRKVQDVPTDSGSISWVFNDGQDTRSEIGERLLVLSISPPRKEKVILLANDFRLIKALIELDKGSAPNKAVQPDAVHAFTLAREYQRNEIAADEKYLNRELSVTGKIQSIDRAPSGSLRVRLAGEEAFSVVDIDCIFSENKRESVSRLSSGDTVTITGRCVGLSFMNVGLEDCVIE